MRRARTAVSAVTVTAMTLGFGAAMTPVLAAAPTTAAPSAIETVATTGAAAGKPTQRVIVLLRNQLAEFPATAALVGRRVQALAAAQAPVVSALRAAGTTTIHSYTTVNALSATVSPAEEAALRADPSVAEVIPDEVIAEPAPAESPASQAKAAAAATNGQAFCAPAGAKPQLNPEALQATNTDSQVKGAKTARSLGFTGKGVKVAYIAEGIDINNPDFIRADGSHVFVDYKDFTGEGANAPTTGAEAFIDASSIAAQGRKTYDVSHFSALPLSKPCRIRIEGMAPGASLVGLKVFANASATFESNFLQAIDYAVAVDHVNVLSESFGSNPLPDTAADATRLFDDAAVRAGVTVVASSGDAGVTNTIGSPASDPAVISTGASTTYRLFLQTGYGFAHGSHATGYLNNNISSLSSSGFTQAGRSVDLVAPGELGFGLCSADTAMYSECLNFAGQPSNVEDVGGTSQSAPLTAGAAALVIQAYKQSHRGTRPTPAIVKQILTGTATDISAPSDQQGTGLLDSYRAVQAALSAPGSTHNAVGQALLTSTDQVEIAKAPGSAVHSTVTLTNAGAASVHVALRTRAIGPYRTLKQVRVVLSNNASGHAPDFQGFTDNVDRIQFRVPAGLSRLDASIAYQGASAALSSRVRLTLVDPAKRLAGYSLPQGVGNYGDSQVANPKAGVWTAYITSRQPADGGTTGPVVFGARGADFVTSGRVSPTAVTIGAGQSVPVTFTGSTPSALGDAATAIVLSSTSIHTSSVTTLPVLLRSVAQVTAAPKTFRETVRGGNGRSPFAEVTGYYALQVPHGLPELNSTVKLLGNIDNPFAAYLISPGGQAVAFGSSQLPGSDSAGDLVAISVRSAQLHVIKPAAGRWTLIVNFAPTVSGMNLSQPYTVKVDGRQLEAMATGLPTSVKTKIRSGTTTTVKIRVHNSGSAPELLFLDPRRNANVRYSLAVQSPAVTLPDVSFTQPVFLVPTDSSKLLTRFAASGPVTFDFGPAFGDPDRNATIHGRVAAGVATGAPLTQGVWGLGPDEIGPFGDGGEPTVTGRVTASVVTKMFDPTIKSSTGDLWLEAINPTASFAPVVVLAGQTKTITVHIAPTGKKGTAVRGVLYVDDANLLNVGNLLPNGNQVAALPYSYTIG